MRDLAALQAAMSEAIFSGDVSALAGELTAGCADARRRFGIFRNNTFLSLTAHLKTVFPMTARLADERFFAYAAHQFIRAHPPRDPRLSAYGLGFDRFLAVFPASRHTPLLAAMASLEWAVHAALVSSESPPLTREALAAVDPAVTDIGFELQPSLRFVVSRWPLLELWSGRNSEGAPLPRRLFRVALFRHNDVIRFLELDSARFSFWRGLSRGRSLVDAAGRALARESRFNLADEILILFDSGLVSGLMRPATE
jgi:hypothetical protein